MYPVLYTYAHNPFEIGFSDLFKVVGALAVLVTLSWAALSRLTGQRHQAAFSLALPIFWFLTYGSIYSQVSLWRVGGQAVLRHKILLPLSVGALAWLLWPRRRLGARSDLVSVLNTVSAVLVLMACGQASWRVWNTLGPAGPRLENPFPRSVADGSRPNVVLIVLDGYAREDVLKRYYDFDNSAFLQALESRGFQVGRDSRACYPWTPPSLASLLNAQYLPESCVHSSGDSFFALLRNNWVMQFFRELGYKVVISSYSSVTDHIGTPHQQLRRSLIGAQFYEILVKNSLWSVFSFNPSASYPGWVDWRAQAVVAGLEHLKGLSFEGPTFALVHILCPHRPLFCRADGSALDSSLKQRDADYRELYPQQLQYLNARVLEGLDHLLALPQPPVILLVSDHGSLMHSLQPSVSFVHPNPDLLKERIGNLCAFYYPGKSQGEVKIQGMVLVNVFRHLANTYFGCRMPLLPAHCYWTDGDIGEVTQVTEKF